MEVLARELDGLSGAEIAGLCQRAVHIEIERFVARHGDAAEDKAALGELILSRQALQDAIAASRAPRPFNRWIASETGEVGDANLP
jgi:SpoVK/Ycf46/Vps4 family AAA+-type ATPase